MKKIKYARIYEYNRRKTLNADGTSPVVIRLYLNTKNIQFQTGIFLSPDQWDNKNHKVKNHPYQLKCEQQIRKLETALETFEWQLMENGETVTLLRMKDYKNGLVNKTFTQFYWDELNKEQLSHGSFTDQRQTFDKLKAFRDTIYFNQVNFKLVKEFDRYLLSKLGVNTVAKHHKNLRKYINLAINYGYLKQINYPYTGFRIRTQPPKRIYLIEEELEQLEKAKLDSPELNLVRDFFLFMCYTGLRYSDASKVNPNHFYETNKGFIYDRVSKKTLKSHRLNLSKIFGGKPAKLIKRYLERYDEMYFDDPDNPTSIFFGMTGAHVNRQLKVIAKKMEFRKELREKMCCHSARHTFGTIITDRVGVHKAKELLQHSNIKETMIYAHLSPELIDAALDKVKW